MELNVMLSTVHYMWGNTSRLSGFDPRTDSVPSFFLTPFLAANPMAEHQPP